MFTIKYQTYELAAVQQDSVGPHWVRKEQLHGPFDFVSQEWAEGLPVIHCHDADGGPAMMFGPVSCPDEPAPPRPVAYVMNAQGATISKYDL